MTFLVDVFEPGRHLCDMAEIMFEEDFSVSLAVGWSFCPSCVSLGLCDLVAVGGCIGDAENASS